MQTSPDDEKLITFLEKIRSQIIVDKKLSNEAQGPDNSQDLWLHDFRSCILWEGYLKNH